MPTDFFKILHHTIGGGTIGGAGAHHFADFLIGVQLLAHEMGYYRVGCYGATAVAIILLFSFIMGEHD